MTLAQRSDTPTVAKSALSRHGEYRFGCVLYHGTRVLLTRQAAARLIA